MATRKEGYGSRTDYWLVLCGPDPRSADGARTHVVRVQVQG